MQPAGFREGLVEIIKEAEQLASFHRIERLADVIVTRDLFDLEKRAGIVAAMSLLMFCWKLRKEGHCVKKTAKADAAPETHPTGHVIPSVEWILETNEALGDAAIAAVLPLLPGANRVDLLFERLEAMPDHEKLLVRLQQDVRHVKF